MKVNTQKYTPSVSSKSVFIEFRHAYFWLTFFTGVDTDLYIIRPKNIEKSYPSWPRFRMVYK